VRDQAHDNLEANQVVDICGKFAAIVAGDNDEREASDALLFGEGIDEPLENEDSALDWMVMSISAWRNLIRLVTRAMVPEYVFADNESE
jgi:hypothetical protein